VGYGHSGELLFLVPVLYAYQFFKKGVEMTKKTGKNWVLEGARQHKESGKGDGTFGALRSESVPTTRVREGHSSGAPSDCPHCGKPLSKIGDVVKCNACGHLVKS